MFYFCKYSCYVQAKYTDILNMSMCVFIDAFNFVFGEESPKEEDYS